MNPSSTQWNWLTTPLRAYRWGFVVRVVLKAVLLFALLNLAFAALMPLPWLGRLSVHNLLLPGRERLPYGDNPAAANNLTLANLEAMFAAHRLAAPAAEDEFRVLLIGDSATWGFLLEPEDTLAGQLSRLALTRAGQPVQVYNLGYPTMSLTKDLVLLERGLSYDPDLVIWLFTAQSFPRPRQIPESPLLHDNAAAVRDLIRRYDLDLNADHRDLWSGASGKKRWLVSGAPWQTGYACKPMACCGPLRGAIRPSPPATSRAPTTWPPT
ncbi:MAG: SGNH/GDSL hydrolase family protein [Anaerolineae bacterium]|nr:SGNH/GDSL hydrolase family protein [Anaerolineae bacterium]